MICEAAKTRNEVFGDRHWRVCTCGDSKELKNGPPKKKDGGKKKGGGGGRGRLLALSRPR